MRMLTIQIRQLEAEITYKRANKLLGDFKKRHRLELGARPGTTEFRDRWHESLPRQEFNLDKPVSDH